MKKFTITFKVRRETRVWFRFANDIDTAIASANKALDDEFFGDAKLISVSESQEGTWE